MNLFRLQGLDSGDFWGKSGACIAGAKNKLFGTMDIRKRMVITPREANHE